MLAGKLYQAFLVASVLIVGGLGAPRQEVSVIAESGSALGTRFSGPTDRAIPHPQQVLFERPDLDSSTVESESRTSAQLFVEGEKLRTKWTAESQRKAIEKYEAALSVWKTLNMPREQASAYRALGETWYLLAEPRKALECYEPALALSKRIKDLSGEGDALNGIGYVYLSFGDHRRALKYLNEALRLNRRSANVKGEAQSLNNLGETYYGLRNLPESLKYYELAMSCWQRLQDQSGQAQALLNFGYTYSDLNDTQNALSHYNGALALWQTISNPHGEALTLTALGHLHSKLGDKQKALDLYNKANALLEPMGDKTGRAFVWNGLGYVYEEMGDPHKSLENYTNALQLFQETHYREGEAGSLYKIGKAHFSLGEYETALKYFHQSREVSQSIGDVRMEALPVGLIGQTLVGMGKAEEALRYYREALRLNRAGSDRREEAYTLRNIGFSENQLGRKEKALSYFKEALDLNRLTGDRFGESSTRYGIARIKRDLGRLEDAHSEMTGALALAESLRTSVVSSDLRLSYAANLRQGFELQIDILMQMHQRDPRSNFNSLAFEISERARARALLDSLSEAQAQIRQGADRVLLEKETQIEEQLNKKADEQARLMVAGKNAEVERVKKEITQLTSQYDEVRSKIKLSNPRYAALTQPQPLTLKNVQKEVLDDNALLLEYALGDQRSYLWAITKTQCLSYSLPGRAEIETVAREVYRLITANQPVAGETSEQLHARVAQANEQLPAETQKLSSILLDPVADRLGKNRLLVVSDGALQYIPFQILTKPVKASGFSTHSTTVADRRRLVEDHEVVNQPSASALALLLDETKTRMTPSRSVAVFADPVFEFDDPRINNGLATSPIPAQRGETAVHRALRDVGVSGASSHIPRLQASGDEADAIISAAPWRSGFKATGFEATRTTAMEPKLGDYRIVHFATHGLLNNEHPELSGIVLSLVNEQGQPQDGFLRLHDIYNLNLPVDLVVLSACNTGLGKDVRGEGLIGLTRGFMYAGASSVVASLWKVDDDATAELMKLFYTGMLKEGLSPAAALRKAQLTMSKQKRWQSPYYWSGFIIQGQYAQPQRPLSYAWRKSELLVGVAVVLTLLAFFIWKRRRSRVL